MGVLNLLKLIVVSQSFATFLVETLSGVYVSRLHAIIREFKRYYVAEIEPNLPWPYSDFYCALIWRLHVSLMIPERLDYETWMMIILNRIYLSI